MDFRNEYVHKGGRIAEGHLEVKNLGFKAPHTLHSLQGEIMGKMFFQHLRQITGGYCAVNLAREDCGFYANVG